MNNARPFCFGIALSESVSSREEWIGLARRAENLGYATLLVAKNEVFSDRVVHSPKALDNDGLKRYI